MAGQFSKAPLAILFFGSSHYKKFYVRSYKK